MKKLILFGIAGLVSLGLVSAQGYNSTGAHDDFASATQYSNATTGEGLYWFELTGGDTLAITRSVGKMTLAVTTAGGCNFTTTGGVNVGKCYPVFGVDFGNDGGSPATLHTVDLSGGADVKLDIKNNHASQTFFMTVILEDINGVKAEIEPNVSDVTSTAWTGSDRKALNGLTLAAGERKTVRIDLSSVPTAIGGLTPGAYTCSGPVNCPVTNYSIDITQIKAVLFQVNFGKDDINISEGDGDHTAETFLSGSSIASFTGNIEIFDFKLGSDVIAGVNEAAINNSLKVYPNPANDVLNVSFETSNAAEVSLSNIVGTKVYTSNAAFGSNKMAINTSGLSSGIYILNIATENGVVARKVTIK